MSFNPFCPFRAKNRKPAKRNVQLQIELLEDRIVLSTYKAIELQGFEPYWRENQALNNKGEILGHYEDSYAIWRDGDIEKINLDFAPVDWNDKGQIAGTRRTSNKLEVEAVYLAPDKARAIDHWSAHQTETAAVWSGGASSALGPPGRLIVTQKPTSADNHVFVTEGHLNSGAYFLTDDGQVIGSYLPGSVTPVSYDYKGDPIYGARVDSSWYDKGEWHYTTQTFVGVLSGGGEMLGIAGERLKLKHTSEFYSHGTFTITAVNNANQAVGMAFPDRPVGKSMAIEAGARPVLWDGFSGVPKDLSSDGTVFEPIAINDNGMVSGVRYPKEDRSNGFLAVVWHDGQLTNLGDLDHNLNSKGLDINNSGVVVGFTDPDWTGFEDDRAIVWDEQLTQHDLNDKVHGLASGVVLHKAVDINNQGQILASSGDGSGKRWFLLNPTMTVQLQKPDQVALGEEFDVTISVTNNGDVPLTDIIVSSVQFKSHDKGKVTRLDNLAEGGRNLQSGQSTTYTVSYRAEAMGRGQFDAVVTAQSPRDGEIREHVVSTPIKIEAQNHLHVEAKLPQDKVKVEDEFEVTFNVTNKGDHVLKNITLQGVEVVGIDGGSVEEVNGPGTGPKLAALEPGQSVEFTYTYKALTGGKVTFEFLVTAWDELEKKNIRGFLHSEPLEIAVKDYSVVGTIYDMVLEFPAQTRVRIEPLKSWLNKEERPVIRLINVETGKIVAEDNIYSTGDYRIETDDPGEYRVEVVVKVNRYDSVSNQIKENSFDITQRTEKTVTIEEGEKKPIQAPDLQIPVSIFNREAELIHKLRNHEQLLAASGLINLILPSFAEWLNKPFEFYTTDVENLLEAALQQSVDKPFKVFNGTGNERDYFNVNLRLTALMETIVNRYEEDLRLSDQFGKATSLLIMTQIIRPAMRYINNILAKHKLPKDPGWKDLTSEHIQMRALKATLLAKFVNASVDFVLDQLGFIGIEWTREQKESFRQAVFMLMRFSLDALSGQIVADGVFEVPYHVLRFGLSAWYMSVSFEGLQSALDEATALGTRRIYDGDTDATLDELKLYEGIVAARTKYILDSGAYAQGFINNIRLISGLADFGKKLAEKSLPGNKNLRAKQLRVNLKLFGRHLERLQQRYPKRLGDLFDRGITKIANTVLSPAYTVAIVGPWYLQKTRLQDIDAMARLVMSGPVGNLPDVFDWKKTYWLDDIFNRLEQGLANQASNPDQLADLQVYYGFHFADSYWQNLYGRQEKWFKDRSNQWFFVDPKGLLYEWNGKDFEGSSVVEVVGAAVYNDPNLLFDAEVELPDDAKQQLGELRERFGFHFADEWYVNLKGKNEKWFKDRNDQWFFITPDGKVQRWDSEDIETSILEATVSPLVYDNPYLLFDAEIEIDTAPLSALRQLHGFYFDEQWYLNLHGLNEKWIRNRHGQWHFITPDGDVHEWNRGDIGAGAVIATLSAVVYDDPSLLLNAEILLSNEAARQIAEIQQQFAFQAADSYHFDWIGRREKWFKDRIGHWFAITAHGRIYRWNGRSLDADSLVVTVDPLVYDDPELLFAIR